MGKEKPELCPRCNISILKDPISLNALSQEDGKTYICSNCGINESRIKWFKAKSIRDEIPKEQTEMAKKFREKLGVVDKEKTG